MLSIYLLKPCSYKYIKINTNCIEIHSMIGNLYGKYTYTDIQDDVSCFEINVEKYNDDKYYVVYYDKKKQTNNPLQEIVNIIFENASINENIFALHSGCVYYNNHSYLFAASTSSGKTTLTAFLTLKGLNYATDDCTYIDMKNFDFYPYQVPIHLRAGGMQVLKEYDTEPPISTIINTPTIQRFIFNPDNLSPDVMKLGYIFFIERTDEKNEVVDIPTSKALVLLMKNAATTYKVSSKYISFLSKLSSKCKILRYSDMNFVLDYIKELSYE
ncbi:MAG: hypothetical protein A2Y40_06515 [Candidatus Margulisbacteria bacterium GWF2_35_9]|nr:MAG: hypothetical protein A2Y40_06515 [Candidatus Margulisbacteria bacterium GWF2_35_9]